MSAERPVLEPGKKGSSPWLAVISIFALSAVVAAVLIPSYADYADREQSSEAVSVLAGTKTRLAEYYADQKKWPSSLGEVAGTLSGKYVQSIAITKGAGGTAGEIEVTAVMKTEGADRRVAGKSVKISSSDGGKNWLCRAGTMPEKSLPEACRTR